MKLIVGLGNPGVDYALTRHNTGYVFVDELLKEKYPKDVIVRKINIFMNESGVFVAEKLKAYSIKPEDLFVVHDDLDIPLGEFKIQYGRGPKDHNGLKSIDEALGTDEYWHVRVGIDNRPIDNRPMGEEYVLQNFSDEERTILNRVIKEASHKLISDLQFKTLQ
jgi:PTH1 family peptidyl-tRNA hydrolase